MNFNKILTIIIILFVLLELIEHIIFPLIWSIVIRNRKPLVGIESMVGKEVKVIKWQFTYGIVFFNGEIWKATSNSKLLPGDKAIIDKIDGLLLTVMSINKA